MVPITALMVLTTAYGIWKICRRHVSLSGLPLAPVLVILVTAVIESFYLLGFAPFPFQLAASGTETPVTLASPMTAGMFCALGSAALMLMSKRLTILAQCLAVVVLLVALLNLGGYLLQDTILFQVLPSQGTSILTSAALILLAAATLFAYPHAGLMIAITGDLPGARISRHLLLSVLLIPIATGMVVAAGSQLLFYDAETMLILFVWIVILLLLTVVWRLAMRLAASDKERANAQDNLRRALSDLKATHDEKDLFMATLAHELRNPLVPISSAAELLKHGGARTDADRKRIGEVIAAQCTNLVTIVNDLMDMERLNTGRLTLNKAPIDVRTVIYTAVEQDAPLLARKQHQYHVDLPITPACVCGDVLLYANGHFIQCLEGPDASLRAVFASILADVRHRDIYTLVDKAIEQRDFAGWTMGYAPLEAKNFSRLLTATWPLRDGDTNPAGRSKGKQLLQVVWEQIASSGDERWRPRPPCGYTAEPPPPKKNGP